MCNSDERRLRRRIDKLEEIAAHLREANRRLAAMPSSPNQRALIALNERSAKLIDRIRRQISAAASRTHGTGPHKAGEM